MEKDKKVLFDPGYAPIVVDSIGLVGYNYYTFSAIPNVKIKKLNFPSVLKKIEDLLEKNISFYLGCLLWASCIANLDDYELIGNKLLGQEASEEEYTSEINFLTELIEKGLDRDCKYFTGKPYCPNKKYLNILKTYKKFLIINKGFVNCSKTNQIVLPENLKKLSEKQIKEVKEKIDTAINLKDITLLLNEYGVILQ